MRKFVIPNPFRETGGVTLRLAYEQRSHAVPAAATGGDAGAGTHATANADGAAAHTTSAKRGTFFGTYATGSAEAKYARGDGDGDGDGDADADADAVEAGPAPPPGTLRAEVAKGVKRFLLQ